MLRMPGITADAIDLTSLPAEVSALIELTTETKNPSRINDLGFFLGRPGKDWEGLEHGYMFDLHFPIGR